MECLKLTFLVVQVGSSCTSSLLCPGIRPGKKDSMCLGIVVEEADEILDLNE